MDNKEKRDIILVDDEDVVLNSSRKILKSEGYSVDAVSTAEDAIELLEGKSYRIMITDLMMPGISGFNLMEKVKVKYPLMPIIIITGYATMKNIMSTFNSGGFDFIPKPFTFDELLAVVNRGFNYVSHSLSFGSRDEYLKSIINDEELGDYYFLGDHSWVKFCDDDSAKIGVGLTFCNSMGEISDLQLPEKNREITQGNPFAGIFTGSDIAHRVLSPVSGRIIENNTRVLEDNNLINSDPFFNGWLTRIIPLDKEREVVYLNFKTDKSLI